jgi:N-dimethylarginine dimethylaminohydrolase
MDVPREAAAYGGPAWSPRATQLREEIGRVWGACGVASETARLEAVLLHRPGGELDAADPDAALLLAPVDATRAAAEHESLTAAYREAGVAVACVDPPRDVIPPPNLMFVADLMFMTPEGAILARPASSVRAGEERWIARRLADLGVPILRSVRGTGVFEGADAAWLDERTVLLARGLRTNAEGAAQVAATLRELGVAVVSTELPPGTMHLMGQLRFLDRELAVVRADRIDAAALAALRSHGYTVAALPDDEEMDRGFAHNLVTLGPREVLMPADRPVTRAFFESLGVRCRTVVVDELIRAAGGIGCLTGVLRRARPRTR